MSERSIAVFVSPHGFGHAARASAVMAALHRLDPGLRFEVFTTVPAWFFKDTPGPCCRVHCEPCDVGLAQSTAMEVDLAATVDRLDGLLPPDPARLERLAATVDRLGCSLVLCDIAPLGLAAARRAGRPAVLVESFTWHFIYQAYLGQAPRLSEAAEASRELVATAALRVQTEPVCDPSPHARRVPPVSRPPRTPPDQVRRQLGVGHGEEMVLVTMGGLGWRYAGLDRLVDHARAVFVVPGGADRVERRGRLRALPHRSGFHHPDLVAAADLVVGKLGYSTVAEAVHAGSRLLYLPRPGFPESPVLEAYVRSHLAAAATTTEELDDGRWVDRVDPLLDRDRTRDAPPNGAAEAARSILALL